MSHESPNQYQETQPLTFSELVDMRHRLITEIDEAEARLGELATQYMSDEIELGYYRDCTDQLTYYIFETRIDLERVNRIIKVLSVRELSHMERLFSSEE